MHVPDVISVAFRLLSRFCCPKLSSEIRGRAACAADLFLAREGCIANTVLLALLAGEDHRSFEHTGIDAKSIGRAIVMYHLGQSIQGASTIEQQLVRTLMQDYRRSFARKIREMIVASSMFPFLEKNLIYAAYLEVAYFGAGMKGYRAACGRLHIDPAKPTLHQAAGLVARLKYPQPSLPTPLWAQRLARRTAYIEARSACGRIRQSRFGEVYDARFSELS